MWLDPKGSHGVSGGHAWTMVLVENVPSTCLCCSETGVHLETSGGWEGLRGVLQN